MSEAPNERWRRGAFRLDLRSHFAVEAALMSAVVLLLLAPNGVLLG
jgi:hypothetical protein